MNNPLVPLTDSQMLIWTGQQLSPDAPIYNMAFRFELSGAIDANLFREAFSQLVQSSDAMRCTIEMQNGMPFSCFHDSMPFHLRLLDSSTKPEPLTSARIWCDQRCQKLFHTGRQMFDSALLQVGKEQFVWYLCMHHLISDALAFQVALERLNNIYLSLASSSNDIIQSPRFEKYVEYEKARNRLASKADSDSEKSIESRLPAFYGLPTVGKSWQSRRLNCETGSSTLENFSQLTQRSEARSFSIAMSQFNLFATALFAFLYRVSGQSQLKIGAPFHNRSNAEFKDTVGLFIEMFPLSVSISDDETYLSLLQKVKIATNRFLKQATTQAPSSTTLYNAVFNFIPTNFGTFQQLPVTADWLHPGGSDRQHPIRMHVQQFRSDELPTVKLDLNTSVFDDTSAERVKDHFNRILSAMSDNWNSPVSEVELVDESELNWQQQLLNGQVEPELPKVSILDEFARRTAENPQAIALTCDQSNTTYAELDQWSDRIATGVPPASSRPNVIVIAIERSPEFVAAILGILKAGGAFVPIDPAWPATRIASVVEQSGANTVFCRSGKALNIPTGAIRIDIESITGEDTESQVLNTARGEEDLAYILFTSGSTGQPKGIKVSHRSLSNYSRWARQFYCGNNKLSFPFFTPTTFDLTLTSIFVPLISGGRIVVYTQPNNAADTSLLEALRDDQVDIIKLTPAHLGLLQDQQLSGSRVKQLILGGEHLTTVVANQTQRLFGNDITIHNEYGPTEATVGCIVRTFDPQHDIGSSVPIGAPITNMQALILDAQMNRVPTGVSGQLFLSGAGLADGYINQPKLTVERFTPNPFDRNQMIYRTGDLARMNHKGQIEYLGRIDHQVKILGARIELPEVEHVLRKLHGIESTVAGVIQLQRDIESGLTRCERCGLPSNYPDAQIDSGLCNQCRSFEQYRHRAEAYFQSMDTFHDIFKQAQTTSDYDCLALLSGGKDSTYMVGRLADMGVRVLAFTLDNGFISAEAKANIRRVVATLGVDHVFGSTDSMNEIFVDSLKRHSNVCHGCFKTIYTLSTKLALEKGIPFIVTGLSRGQFFETRLTEELFTSPTLDPSQIDQMVLDARKAYHRIDDAVSRCMDVELLQDDETFEKVRYLDFYRYCPVDLDEMYDYLDRRLPWVRPGDTGRSTNCLINDTGIYVHKKERGFHNYALPYSWDVRLGHKTRDAAIQELEDDIDVDNVHRILQEIGYDEQLNADTGARLIVWYTTQTDGEEIPVETIREHFRQHLPNYMIPSHFVRVDKIPLTANGKVDQAALPSPLRQRLAVSTEFIAASTEIEKRLCEIWTSVLGQIRIGVHDNFFDLGGDSILAIQIVARGNRQGLYLQPGDLFDAPTIAELATRCRKIAPQLADETPGEFAPTPIQRWYFEHQLQPGDYWNQSIMVQLPKLIDQKSLASCLNFLTKHHDAFRQRFSSSVGNLQAETVAESAVVPVRVLELAGTNDHDTSQVLQNAERELHECISLESGNLLAALLVHRPFQGQDESTSWLLLVAHHLAVDAVSWTLILEQLSQLFEQHKASESLTLERAPSFRTWANALKEFADSETIMQQKDEWTRQLSIEAFDPVRDYDGQAGDLMKFRAELTPAETSKLTGEVLKLARASVEELLFAATFAALGRYSKHDHIRVFIERHGRQSVQSRVDPAQTVGWFTSIFPVTLKHVSGDSIADLLRNVKETVRKIPNKGIGCGLMKNELPSGHHQTGILFNYLGQIDKSGFDDLEIVRPLKLHRNDSCPVQFPWQINCWIERERLVITMDFDKSHHELSEIGGIVQFALERICELTNMETWNKGQAVVASDFPLANLDKHQLSKLSSLLLKKDPGDSAN